MKRLLVFILFSFLSQALVAEENKVDTKLCESLSVQDIADIGWMFWQKKEYGKSFKWDSYAAKLGNIYGQKRTGLHYQRGLGVEKNYGLAVYWHKKSAMQGDYYSMYNLALIYSTGGPNLKKDNKESYKWALLGSLHTPSKEQDIVESINQLLMSLDKKLSVSEKEKAKKDMEAIKIKQTTASK
jgi:TPR repeat protein